MPTNDKPTPGGRLTEPTARVWEITDPAARESAAFALIAAVVLREALGVIAAGHASERLAELLPDVLEASLATAGEAHHLAALVGGDPALLEARALRHVQAAVGALLVGAPWAAIGHVEPAGAIA